MRRWPRKRPALGEAIAQEILRTNLNPRDVVIYGHSLGAQAAGFAGSILANHPRWSTRPDRRL